MKLLLILTLFFPIFLVCQSGELDVSFSENGIDDMNLGGGKDIPLDILLQKDGKLIISGRSIGTPNLIHFVRYNINGELDWSFSNGGLLWERSPYYPQSIIQTGKGDYLVGCIQAAFFENGYDYRILKLTNKGKIDTTFGEQGYYALDLPYTSYSIYELIQMESGLILGVGRYLEETSDTRKVFVTRFAENGDIDLSFGVDGIWSSDMITNPEKGLDMIVDEEENIYLAASFAGDLSEVFKVNVIKLNNNGSIAIDYGDNGIYKNTEVALVDESVNELGIFSDRSLVLDGHINIEQYSENSLHLIKITSEGFLDETFATNSALINDLIATRSSQVEVLNDDSFIRASTVGTGGDQKYRFNKYLSDGRIDVSFTNTGRKNIDLGPYKEELINAIKGPGQKLYTLGVINQSTTTSATNSRTVVAKFHNACEETMKVYPDVDEDGFGDANRELCPCIGNLPKGSLLEGGDCDDNSELVNPAATETCNFIDDNCDGEIDEGFLYLDIYPDHDGDGYGDLIPHLTCDSIAPEGYVTIEGDCDDYNIFVNPGITEIVYNGIDDDCNSTTLDDDLDQDGFLVADDCDDNNVNINPDAEEIPNNEIDEDCDGLVLILSTHEIANTRISIYPNPVIDFINIDVDGLLFFRINLYNLEGKVIFSISNTNQINLAELPSGIYLLELQDIKSGQKIVERIVKGK